MRQMVFEGPGRARWHDVAPPRISDDSSALVEPLAVATCDADVGFLQGKTTFWGAGFAMGHEAVVRIVETGDDVRYRKPGDVAVVPFQVSCGECDNCRGGLTAHCTGLPGNPMFGLGEVGGNYAGMLADRFLVPFADHMLVPVPDGVDPTWVASASDNLPDAYRCAREGLDRKPGAEVLVVGGRAVSIALYSIQFALAAGAAHVTFADRDEKRLAKAERLGAEPVSWPEVGAIRRHEVTIDASGGPAGLLLALRSTDHEGVCINAAMPFGEYSLRMLDMYIDCVTLLVGRNSARSHIPAALDLVAGGAVDPSLVTDRVVSWDAAEEALCDPPDKLVIVGPGE